MKRVLLLALILSTVTVPLLVASPANSAVFEEDTPLAKHMDSINDHLRELRGQIGDAARKAENLAIVQTVRENFEEARKLVPEKAAELSGPDREAFLKGFRSKIDQVLGTVDELAKAIDSGMTDEAGELLVKLNDLKKEGHSEFKKPE